MDGFGEGNIFIFIMICRAGRVQEIELSYDHRSFLFFNFETCSKLYDRESKV